MRSHYWPSGKASFVVWADVERGHIWRILSVTCLVSSPVVTSSLSSRPIFFSFFFSFLLLLLFLWELTCAGKDRSTSNNADKNYALSAVTVGKSDMKEEKMFLC